MAAQELKNDSTVAAGEERAAKLEAFEVALEVAERLLMEADHYDYDTRIVKDNDLLRIVQELNFGLKSLRGEEAIDDKNPEGS